MSRITLLLALCLCAASCSFAIPTLTGPSGLVTLPDALPVTGVQAAGSIVDNDGDQGLYLRAVAGIGRGEIGAALNSDDEDTWGANAKIRLMGGDRLSVSGGALVLQNDIVDTTALYVAATVTPPTSIITLTAGATWTKLSTDVGDADAFRPYAGAKVVIPLIADIVAEYQGKSGDLGEDKPITSLMVVRRGALFTTAIGMTNAMGLVGTDDHDFFATVAIGLGK